MSRDRWPLTVWTSARQATILLERAQESWPRLLEEEPDLRAVALYHDFLFPVRLRPTIDDRMTSIEMAALLQPWYQARLPEVAPSPLAFAAAALGKGASYQLCGDGVYLNLSRRDFQDRLDSYSRQVRRPKE